MKHVLIGTVIGLLLAIFLPLVIYQELSWLQFINMTFYIVGGLFTFSLLSLVIQKGFFDVTFRSFRKFLQAKHNHLDVEDEEIRKLSDIISLPYGGTFIVGLILTTIMLISLYFYYW
jgi:Domain of unknown function (DUF3899)